MALECAHSAAHAKVPLPNDLLFAVFDAIINELGSPSQTDTEDSNVQKLEPYHVGEVLGTLQKSKGLTPAQIERLQEVEWFFLPILKHYGSPRILLARLRSEPTFFIEVLTLGGYRRDKPEPAESADLSEREKNAATVALQLLESVRTLPGAADDGRLDEEAFRAWVREARELAVTKGYARASEYVLGKWLLHSSIEERGIWPCEAVCRLLTLDGSDKMRDSFEMAIFNNQGWPGPLGKDRTMSSRGARHEAMGKLHELADKIELEFPLVAGILRSAGKAQEEFLKERLRDDE